MPDSQKLLQNFNDTTHLCKRDGRGKAHRLASSKSQLILNRAGAYLVGDTTLLLSGPLRGHEGQKNRIKIPRR